MGCSASSSASWRRTRRAGAWDGGAAAESTSSATSVRRSAVSERADTIVRERALPAAAQRTSRAPLAPRWGLCDRRRAPCLRSTTLEDTNLMGSCLSVFKLVKFHLSIHTNTNKNIFVIFYTLSAQCDRKLTSIRCLKKKHIYKF